MNKFCEGQCNLMNTHINQGATRSGKIKNGGLTEVNEKLYIVPIQKVYFGCVHNPRAQ